MGRFYKTTAPTPIDYMYRDNVPLMEQALAANDQGINNINQSDAKILDVLDFPHLSEDNEGVTSVTQQYKKQADDIAKEMQNNPAGWRSQTGPLKQLTSKLQEDFRSGDLSKYAGNYNQMKSDFAQADEQSKLYNTSGGEKGTDPTKVNMWKQYYMNNFKGTKNPDGTYNTFKTNPLTDNIDINKKLDDTLSKVVKDKSTTEFTNLKGAYFNDVTKSWEGIPQDKLLSVATNRLLSDPTIMNTLRQESQIGYANGVFYNKDKVDPNGNVVARAGDFREPYNIIPNPISPEEQDSLNKAQNQINLLHKSNPQLAQEQQENLDNQKEQLSNRTRVQWDNGSYLTPYLQGAVQKYSGVTTDSKNSLKNNSFADQQASQAATWRNLKYTQGQENNRQKAGFKQAKEMADINHSYAMDLAAFNKANSGKGPKSATDKNVTVNTVLGNSTSTPYGFLGEDRDKVVNNLNDELSSNMSSIQDLFKKKSATLASGTEEGKDMASFITNQIQSLQSKQINLAQREGKAKEDAVDSIVPKSDLALYNNADEVKKKYYALLDHISGVIPSIKAGLLHSAPEATNFYKVQQYEKDINNKYKDNLLKATKETTNDAPVIETTSAQDDFLRKSINVSPSSFKIIDPKTGEEDHNLNFNSGTIDPFSKDIKIIGTGPSSGLSSKNMPIYVKMKDKNGAEISRQIVPIGPTAKIVQSHLMADFTKSGDPNIKEMATTMSSPYYEPVNDAVTDIIQGDSGVGKLSAAKIKTVDTPAGQGRISITQVGIGDKWDSKGYKVEVETKNGWRTLPNVNEKGQNIGSYFNSDTDIIKALDKLYGNLK